MYRTKEKENINMMTQSDLEKSAVDAVTDKLNGLLADYHVIYGHLHALHWNIEGQRFFTVHKELEDLYDGIAEDIDDVAERILALGRRPVTTLKEYLEISSLEELASRKYTAEETTKLVLKDLDHQISAVRALIEVAGEHNDEGSADFGVEMLRKYEKARWMWSAFAD
jgi:starvation-inducible DNA-binding protein